MTSMTIRAHPGTPPFFDGAPSRDSYGPGERPVMKSFSPDCRQENIGLTKVPNSPAGPIDSPIAEHRLRDGRAGAARLSGGRPPSEGAESGRSRASPPKFSDVLHMSTPLSGLWILPSAGPRPEHAPGLRQGWPSRAF